MQLREFTQPTELNALKRFSHSRKPKKGFQSIFMPTVFLRRSQEHFRGFLRLQIGFRRPKIPRNFLIVIFLEALKRFHFSETVCFFRKSFKVSENAIIRNRLRVFGKGRQWHRFLGVP